MLSLTRMVQQPGIDLLRTKLYRPRVTDDFIVRPRLLERLERGLKRKMILVTAPAGYGKTTLIAGWLQDHPLASAWLSLDEGDNDFLVFLNYCIAALRTVFPEACPETSYLLLTAPRTPASILITRLVNEIDALAQPGVLVLDDYHVLTQADIQEFISQLVDRQPPHFHLVLIMRDSPPLPLARWRARQDMLEIRTADLRFTRDEAHQFLARMTDESAASATTETLETSTEGWIVGLRLAALALRRQTDYARFAARLQQSGVNYVRDYLLDEVLQRQALSLQDFLIKTALLDRFCAELCNALWQRPATDVFAIDLIAQIDRANLFLVPLDDEGQWFRYHHLFGELLRHRAAQRLTSTVIDELHRRAGEWFAAHDLVDEAIQHLLAAHDEAAAAHIVEQNFRQYLNRNNQQRLKTWLAQLPPALIASRPALLIAQAWVRSFEDAYAQIPPLLQQAEELLAREPGDLEAAQAQALRGHIAAHRSQLAFQNGDMVQTLESAEQALALLPEEALYVRGAAINYRCLVWRMTGQPEKAVRFLNDELAQYRGQANSYTASLCLTLCTIYCEAADLDRLYEIAQRLLHEADQSDLPVMRGWALYFMGHARYEANQLDQAYDLFTQTIQLDELAHQQTLFVSRVELALLHQVQGHSDQAEAEIEQLMHLGHEYAEDLPSLRAQLALQRGDLEAALRWADGFKAELPLRPLGWLEAPHLVWAWIQIAAGSPARLSQAETILTQLMELAEAQHNVVHLIGVGAAQAMWLEAQGRTTAALDQLEQAVNLARPGGGVRSFVDLGPVMAGLLIKLKARGVAPQYLDRILTAFSIEIPPPTAAPVNEVNLTWRETEVLRLLAQHLSNQEIAAQLVVTPDAVKKHLQRIYRKLSVSDRRSAINRAAELHLL